MAASSVRLALSLLLCVLYSPRGAHATGFVLSLEAFAEGFQKPSTVTHAGDGTGRLFVGEREGTIRVVTSAGQVLTQPYLDLSAIVGSETIEQGLLALAFHPAYSENGLFYVAYTDLLGDAVVARYRVSVGDPDRADPASATEVLFLPQSSALHNIHELAFGPDGYLYVGSGDGGPAGDPDGQGQALDVLYGKLLRLDVNPQTFPRGGYGIPPDNPFVGVPGARDEIWAFGLRNPANFSFDRATGDLFIADVGQALWEEVNFEPSTSMGGRNYGWNTMEASHCFNPPVGCNTSGLTLPVAEYPHDVDDDCAVIGGYVHRGPAFPWLAGWYLFSDFCSGRVRGLRRTCQSWSTEILLDADFRISAMGEDEAGDVYVAQWSTKSASVLFRIRATPTAEIFADGFESRSLMAWSSCAS